MTRRGTHQQRAIRSVIDSAGRPLSVREIHELASCEAPGLGLRTVYRAVARLLGDGALAPVAVRGQPDRYEPGAVAAAHHHHFHCERCDRVFDVAACAGGFRERLPPGFALCGHELFLWGTCSECA